MSLPLLRFDSTERADLHLHSNWSDGVDGPAELAARAAAGGLQVVALTDHAELRGIAPLTQAAAPLGIYVIPGVELNAVEADLVGLFVDDQHPGLLRLTEDLREERAQRTREVVGRLNALGLPVDFDRLAEGAAPAAPMRTHLARYLVEAGLSPDVDQAFATLLGRGGAAYVPGRSPTAAECVGAIRNAGGIAVAAHPECHLPPGGAAPLFERLARLGVVGCEIWEDGPDAPPLAIQEELRAQARRHEMIPFQASDYHGRPVDSRIPGLRSCGGQVLQALFRRVPPESLHHAFFKRQHWRQQNLSPDEFASSLRPELVELAELGHRQLLDRPRPVRQPPPGAAGRPFVLVRAGGLHLLDIVRSVLAESGGRVVAEHASTSYPLLAWELYDLNEDLDRARRSLLNFGLDRHLYGADAERCVLLFFDGRLDCSFRDLKIRLRRRLGSIRFYRVRCGSLEDTCLTTFVHLPEEDRVALECCRLAALGLEVP